MSQSTRLLSILGQSGQLSAAQESDLQEQMRHHELPAIEALKNSQLFSAATLASILAKTLNLSLVTIDDEPVLTLIHSLELADLTLTYAAVPIKTEGTKLTLAVSDPTQTGLVQTYQFVTGFNIDLVVTDWQSIQRVTKKLNHHIEDRHTHYASHRLAELSETPDETTDDQISLGHNDAPISQYIHQVLTTAYHSQASDVHFEPYEHHYRIRMRIDGLLLTKYTPAKNLSHRLISRIKILANLNIAEKRRPQDGRFKVALSDQIAIDCRVSTITTQWGEKIVLRLLNPQQKNIHLANLGLAAMDRQHYQTALQRSQGMILVTGPTGSGKTMTLYSGLHYLNSEQINISTIEDPIEIQLDGLNQIQINPAIEQGFNDILRTLLRQDPDVIMVGEIRDSETAATAFHAAQTGHLVLSTLHTNSALDTVIRLKQMGIKSYLISSCIQLIIAQRLVRRLCPKCKCPESTERAIEYFFSQAWTAHPEGCPDCINGYQGRLGVFEVLSLSDELRQHINLNVSRHELKNVADKNGFFSLMQSGRQLVEQGETSIDELIRVLGSAEPDETKPR